MTEHWDAPAELTIDGHRATVAYDPELGMFRGEFVGLNGGADFYAADVESLAEEGRMSLRLFLDECAARCVSAR